MHAHALNDHICHERHMLMIVLLASYASWPSVPVVTYQNTIVEGVIKTVCDLILSDC